MSSDEHVADDFEVIDRQEASLDQEELAKVQTWLQPTDYEADSSEFHRHLASQAPGTGLWICETAHYREWHDSDKHASLWIKGVPGAGKSVTAASIAAHLAKTETVPVLTFFFRYIVLTNRTPRGLVRDWLAQLLPSSIKLQATLAPLVTSQLEDMTDEQLWQYLLVGLYDVPKAYCIVDALDEMDMKADDRFLTRLNDLANFRPDTVKVLMTSRPKQYLQSALPSNSIVHISLEKDLVGRDIAIYVSRRLEEALPAPETESFRKEAARAMLERCDGLFLYARLLLDQIIPTLEPASLPDARDVVGYLPVGLEETYNAMLRRQATAVNVDTDLQKFLLEMVTHSVRPLRLNELAQALLGSYPDLGTSRVKAVARMACSPLLEILEDETVQVIHHSLTEFLLDASRLERLPDGVANQFPVLVPLQAHRRLCITCVECLQSSLTRVHEEESGDSESDCGEDEEVKAVKEKSTKDQGTALAFDFQDAKLQFPLLEYAVHNWAYHAGNYDVHDEVFFNFLITFLRPTNNAFRRWLRFGWARSRPDADVPSIIHVAAFSGLTQLAKTLDLAKCVNAIDGGDRTPLFWASSRGHTEIATLLLNSGANPLAEDFDGLQPIHPAAKQNHAQVTKLLLQAGASPIAPKSKEDDGWRPRAGARISQGKTPLQYVCSSGHLETLSVMIPFLSSKSLEEALCQSCWAGRSECVRVLLRDSDVSPDVEWRHGTALGLAVQSLDVVCVELLLNRGANVHATSAFEAPRAIRGPVPRGGIPAPPLHILFRHWQVEKLSACRAIFDLLLRAGAKTDSLDAKGRSMLLKPYPDYAHGWNYLHRTAIQSLLEAGTKFWDTDGDSVLCRCIEATLDIAVLQMLLDHGSNLYHRGRGGNTVLHTVFGNSSPKYGNKQPNTTEEVVYFLLEHGFGPEIKNSSGRTALEAAASSSSCSHKMFCHLFESCSDSEAREKCIWALDVNRDENSIEPFLELILSSGVSLEVRNDRGQTPLLAKLGKSELVVDTLIKHGARLDAVDDAGRGVLHHYIAALSPREENPMPRFRKLLAMGQNVAVLDASKNSLLHELAENWRPHQALNGSSGQVELARFLMTQGLDPNARNDLGQTVFHKHLDAIVRGNLSDDWAGVSTVLRVLQESKIKFEIDARDGSSFTALHFTAGHSEWGFFYLLEVGADPFIRAPNDRTVLHIASRAGKANIVGHILDVAPELLDCKDRIGRTALHDACSEARFEAAYYLVQRGASLNHKDSLGRTPLHACAESETHRSIPKGWRRDLQASGYSKSVDYREHPPSIRNLSWYTCDWMVSKKDKQVESINIAEIVGMLIVACADVKAMDNDQLTPLDLALAWGCSPMARTLATRFPEIEGLIHCQGEKHKARVTVELALHCRTPPSLEELPINVRQELLHHPQLYLSSLNERDLKYIISTGVGPSVPKNGFSTSKLLQDLAADGQIDKMRPLGSIAKEFDNNENVIASVRGQSPKHVNWEECSPPLLAACKRGQPNMAMLKLLVESHGLDVNARGLRKPDGRSRDAEPLLGGTALHKLARAHSWWQLDAIRYLVEHGAQVDARNAWGETPLHIACYIYDPQNHGKNWRPCMWTTDCLRLLISLGADVNAVDDGGSTALHKAGRNANAVRVLLEHGASLTCGKSSPFFSTIAKQNEESVRCMLDAGVSPDTVDMHGSFQLNYRVDKDLKRYALFCACFQGEMNRQDRDSVGIVRLLIERGADLYAQLSEEETLLHYIFQNAEYCIVKAVLEHVDKINFDARDQRGRTVFLAACDWWQTLRGYREEHWYGKEPAPISLILQAKPDIDLRAIDDDKKTVLHHLTDNPDQEELPVLEFLQHPVCKELLHLPDKHGYTPLQYALRTLRPAVVNALLDLGDNLLTSDPTGATAAHHIAEQYLRAHKPRRQSYFQSDEGPDYQQACCALWAQYLARGGDREARDRHGNTPLLIFLASKVTDRYGTQQKLADSCHIENYDALFADANVHARNNGQEGALHIIARRAPASRGTGEHDAALFEFMVTKGLVPLDEDARGRSALDVAAACGNTKVLELYQYRS